MRRLLPLLLLSLCVCGSAQAQSSGKDDTALKNVARQLLDAQIGYDAKKLDSLFTPDYIEISPLGEFDPRAKVLSFYAPDQKPTVQMSVTVQDYGIFDPELWQVRYCDRPSQLLDVDGWERSSTE